MDKREYDELLKPLIDRIRADERERCMRIAISYKTWDNEQPTRKNIKHWITLIEHGRGIAEAIGRA